MLLVMIVTGLSLNPHSSETVQAADSYTDAKIFYKSTGQNAPYHAEMVNGSIYYATCGKLASSSTNLRYYTIGFDISMSANGYMVSFQVQREASKYLVEVDSKIDEEEGYSYVLYMINEEKLYELAELVSSKATVEKLMESSTIKVRIDAIITTKKGNKLNGEVKENGQGGLFEDGKIYHLIKDAELEVLKEIFKGHTFDSYHNIKEDLKNYSLSLRYNLRGTDDANIGCTSAAEVGNGFGITNNYLYKDGVQVIDSYRVLQQFYLPDVGEAGIDLYKKGYHLPDDEEWKTADGRTFSDNTIYMPKDINPDVGFSNKGSTLYANWQRNEYYVVYHPAGGSGTVTTSTFYYDNTETEYLAENTFSRNGYTLPEGKEWIDAEGNTYASGAAVHNLTSEHKKEIVLYANWQPVVVLIQTDQRGGIGGTESFYEKYDIGFGFDTTFVPLIDYIVAPNKLGYDFLGYYRNIFGTGDTIIGNDGRINVGPNYFDKDSVIYAQYKAQPFKITFDKQGGYAGSNEVTATYGEVLPVADSPVRTGYTFKGYFTLPNGQGEQYYNEFMAPVSSTGEEIVYSKLGDTVLYAYWIDESAPELYFVATTTEWTNRKITLTATAVDYGEGLYSLTIYIGDSSVVAATNLNGVSTYVLDYVNEIEGVTNYKAVAVDMKGNKIEAYLTTKYDITPPSGEIKEFVIDENGVTIIVDVTDINTGQ